VILVPEGDVREIDMKYFVVLICAHVLADFLLQPDRIARNKHQLGVLCLHAGVHALLSWLLFGFQCPWQLPAMIFFSHFLIDFFKQTVRDNTQTFCVDQLLHIVVLGFLAAGYAPVKLWGAFDVVYRPLVQFSGFVATVQGSGFLVSKVAGRLIVQNKLNVDGLKGGGKLIGQLERALIFLLVLIGQPAGIGFLVAAKSILRFKESEERKLAEYVLIGTLLSFSLAIALSVLTMKAVTL
jgi:hypothetical protein